MRTLDTFKILLISAFGIGSLGTVLPAFAEEEKDGRQRSEIVTLEST